MPLLSVSATDARHIASLPKYKGQEYLSRKLQLGPINEEEDLKSALLVDYYYDVLQYSTNRGMPWTEVVSSLSFAADMLYSTEASSFANSVRILQNLAISYVANKKLSLRNAKLLSQYITSTFLAHFKLYKHVFTNPQEENRGHYNLTVEVPPKPMKLAEAETLEVWEYANRMHQIDVDEAERKAKLLGLQHQIEMKEENVDQEIKAKYLEGDLETVTMNEAEKLISDVAAMKMSLINEDMSVSITELQDSADIALARQAIPVPPGWDANSAAVPKPPIKSKSTPESRKSSARSTASKKKK